MKVLVSACLLGENCKYNGGNNYSAAVARFVEGLEVVRICPEVLAGLPIPRTPIEISGGQVLDRNGKNVDSCMRRGIALAMEQIRRENIGCAILQSRSPTCGVNQIYDGSFSGKLIPGSGLLARTLLAEGYRVADAEDLTDPAIFQELRALFER